MAVPNAPLETAPCGFVSFGADGRILYANSTLLELLGYDTHEVVGQHVERLLTVGTRIFYQTHWFPLLRLHGHAEEVFLKLRTRANSELGVLSYAKARVDTEGVYDCVLVVVREREKFEAELLRARKMAENANAVLTQQQQALQEANRLLEEQSEELQEVNLVLEEQSEELRTQQEQLRDQAEMLEARTEEAERMRAVADEANRAKSTFLAVMSHELRTPLNAISGYLEILDLEIPGPVTNKQREIFGKIERSGLHLLRLINEVLNLARIEAGHVDYNFANPPVDLIVKGILPMIEPQFSAKNITLRVDVEPGMVVRTDIEKAQQVLLNLLSNAAKFTRDSGHVEVDARRSEKDALIRVRDDGTGIPADKLEAIFQPFVQVDTSRTRKSEGSGLGLAISRDLARGMGGDLRASSVLGEGSEFLFTLPLVRDTKE